MDKFQKISMVQINLEIIKENYGVFSEFESIMKLKFNEHDIIKYVKLIFSRIMRRNALERRQYYNPFIF